MTVRLIFAQSSNGFIGKDNQLLFQIPEDMKQFKEKTQGSTVIMGRRTWESIPEKFRPLPNRRNIVISSQMADGNPGVEVWTSLKAAIEAAQGHGPIWIIGGERLYEEGLQYADEIHETHVVQSFEGDARAPVIDHKLWTRVSESPFKVHDELMYQFNIYVRKDHGNQAQQEDRQEIGGEATRLDIGRGFINPEIVLVEPLGTRGEEGSAGGETRRRGEIPGLVIVDELPFYKQEGSTGGDHIQALNEAGQGCIFAEAGECQKRCGEDDRARCLQAASQAGLEAR